MGEEELGQLDLVAAACSRGDLCFHAIEAKMVVERNRIPREGHQANREFHGFSRETARQPLAVPSFIDLPEVFADVRGKSDPLRDSLCNLAMSDKIGIFTCGPSARPRSTAFASSSGEAPGSFRVMARTNVLTNSSLLPMSIW
jgi:hypothetical protein